MSEILTGDLVTYFDADGVQRAATALTQGDPGDTISVSPVADTLQDVDVLFDAGGGPLTARVTQTGLAGFANTLSGLNDRTPEPLSVFPGNADWDPVAAAPDTEWQQTRFIKDVYRRKRQMSLGINGKIPSAVRVVVRDFLGAGGGMFVELTRIALAGEAAKDWDGSGGPVNISTASAATGLEQTLVLNFPATLLASNWPCLLYVTVTSGGALAPPATPYQLKDIEINY